MLKKLMKHELRSGGRTMLPLLGAVLALSIMLGIFARLNQGQISSDWLNFFFGITTFTYVMGIFAVCILSVVLMVKRFCSDLLGDEAYVMMTLPVSVDAHILSKLICAFLWFAATALVCALSGFIALSLSGSLVFDAEIIQGLFGEDGMFPYLFQKLGIVKPAAYALETLLIGILASCSVCLHFYLAATIGHSFNNHKLLWSAVAFFGISTLFNMLNTALMALLGYGGVFDMTGLIFGEASPRVGALLLYALLTTLFTCLIYYIPTRYILKNKLNLA